MRFFLRSKKFKILSATLIAVLVIAILAGVVGGVMFPGSGLASTIISPFQKLVTSLTGSISDTYTAFTKSTELMDENDALKAEIAALNEQLTDYQDALAENEFYKEYLEIKEQNPDFQFQSAMVISRDSADAYGTFTIDRGSLHGISAHDPVITAQGLVGYIEEVSLTSCKVVTILNPNLSAGGYDSRTADAGILNGDAKLAESGMCRLYNLPRSASVTIGDFIVTSGGGIFPRGLIVGKVADIKQETLDTTITASVAPTAELNDLRQVMVITYFTGQGSLADAEVDK